MNLTDSFIQSRLRFQDGIKLDANESPFNSPDNRYPVSELVHLQELWGRHEHIPSKCIYFCNGTEEAVDLSMRISALDGPANVLSVSPTRSIYKRRATANRLEYREVPLSAEDFSLNVDTLLDAVDEHTKIIYLCSPNSPTGNLFDEESIETILDLFEGWLVVDESYIDFIPHKSVLHLLNKYRNLIVLRSFSHAWASAGARLAAVVAAPDVITRYEQMGLTHPVSSFVVRYMEKIMNQRLDVHKWVRQTIDEREKVMVALKALSQCVEVYPSCTNFLLVRFEDSAHVHQYLQDEGISVRLVQDCLRITIGLPGENSALLGALRKM